MQDESIQPNTGGIRQLLFLVSGIVTVAVGLLGISLGRAWSPGAYKFLLDIEVIKSIDEFMPYFPFVPLYPIFIIMLGAFWIVKSRS